LKPGFFVLPIDYRISFYYVTDSHLCCCSARAKAVSRTFSVLHAFSLQMLYQQFKYSSSLLVWRLWRTVVFYFEEFVRWIFLFLLSRVEPLQLFAVLCLYFISFQLYLRSWNNLELFKSSHRSRWRH